MDTKQELDKGDKQTLNPDAVDAILAAAVRELEHESERFRQTEQKTVAILAFAGVGLTLGAAFAPRMLEVTRPHSWFIWSLLGIWMAGMLCILYGAVRLALSLLSLPFERLDPDNIVRLQEMCEPGPSVKSRLAKTYSEVLPPSYKNNEKKLERFDTAAKFVMWGLGLLVVCVLVATALAGYNAWRAR